MQKPNLKKPPRLAEFLLRFFVPDNFDLVGAGDFEEVYNNILKENGWLKAVSWYWFQVLRSFPIFVKDSFLRGGAMIRNYFKVAFRNIKKNKVYSIINIFGLSIGLACVILIFLFIKDELSFDKFHENSDNIYRLTTNFHKADGSISQKMTSVVIPHGPAMKEFFPEVNRCVRVNPQEFTVKHDNYIEEETVTLVDRDFFEMFSFPLISGNPSVVLSQLNSIVLTESIVKKYFGNSDPIGKILTLIYGDYVNEFIVSGITQNPPSNSTITFDMLVNFESLKLIGNEKQLSRWLGWSSNMQTYIELRDDSSPDDLKKWYPQFNKQYYASAFDILRNAFFDGVKSKRDPLSFGIQKLADIHLDPQLKGSSDLSTIYVLSGIAFIILFIAGINFITLSIGNASGRHTEIGIRKVVGAERTQLIRQFWSESVLITGFAIITGILVVIFILPVFNDFMIKSISIHSLFSLSNLMFLVFLTLIVGISAGSYPALVVSGFKPVEIMKGKLKIRGKNYFTQTLIVIQFACSVFLIVSTLILGKQIHYMLNKDQGFNYENVVMIYNPVTEKSSGLFRHYKDRLENHTSILKLSGVSKPPFSGGDMGDVSYKTNKKMVFYTTVDYNYFDLMEIKFIQGRPFSREFSSDRQSIIVNEKLIKEFDIKNPIGEMLNAMADEGKKQFNIIGVVKDFHIGNCRHEISPYVFYLEPDIDKKGIDFIVAKISPENISGTIELLRSTWKEFLPDKAFNYFFMDESIKSKYTFEKRWNNIVRFSSILAVLISCLGVFGLTSISVRKRTKEVGIRKVHGASVKSIIKLLSKESLLWILIANVIAWPAGWYIMSKWLQSYAFRINISPVTFVLAGLITLILVLGTTCYQTIKAARANPVDSLRYE